MNRPQLPGILVHNRQRKLRIDRAALEKFARRALALCARESGPGLTMLDDIHVLLISDARMSDLHERFLGIAGPTDVLTFEHGEIFISVETAKRQAQSFRSSLGKELRLYLVHGLLHLGGWEDGDATARRRIGRVQGRILTRAWR
jgi:probable rRNA maturation factor